MRKLKRISSSFFPFLSTPNFLFRFYYKYERKLFSLIFRKKEWRKREKRTAKGRIRSSQNKKRRIECINSAVNLEVLRKLMLYKIGNLKKKRQNSFTALLFSSNFPFHNKYERKSVFVIFSFSDSAFLFAIQFFLCTENSILLRPY